MTDAKHIRKSTRKTTTTTTTTTTNVAPSPKDIPFFNFYVLSMSYQPEFCHQHSNTLTDIQDQDYGKHHHHGGGGSTVYPGCTHPLETWKHNLTLHGLWPQYNDGTWPATCTLESFDSNVMKSFSMDELHEKWPNVKSSSEEQNWDEYSSFWEHEWSKHGTCSGLDQYTYFHAAMDNFVTSPAIVFDHYHSELDKSSNSFPKRLLIDGYGRYAEIVPVCSGRYLSEVRICFEKDVYSNLPAGRINCPASVKSEDNCEDDIFIAVFKEDETDVGVNEEIAL